MTHVLPDLPYAYNALEPYIDEQTMHIHHDKHHAAYVNNLNAVLAQHPQLQTWTAQELLVRLADVPESVRTAVQNNAGGHVNHTLFWEIMGPNSSGEPVGELADAIASAFGSFAQFKETFSQAAITRFGSGWAWLAVDGNKKLVVTSTANQDSVLSQGLKPVLLLDVWEHAYYLKYQNRRPDYVAAWWNVVNWQKANELYTQAVKQ